MIGGTKTLVGIIFNYTISCYSTNHIEADEWIFRNNNTYQIGPRRDDVGATIVHLFSYSVSYCL